MRENCAPEEEMIHFWMKVIDPRNLIMISKKDILDLMDKLARGKFIREPTLVSKKFAAQMWKYLKLKKCVNDNDEFISTNLRHALETHQISIELFSQVFRADCEFKVDVESDASGDEGTNDI